MGRITERLDGGLVTSSDPALLSPGELSEMRNAVYFPNSSALCRATGRTAFGAVNTQAAAVQGLRDLVFDNGGHYLLALQGVLLSTAVVGDTGTFASATSVVATATPSGLDAIHFQNSYYLLTGGENLALYLSATAASQPTRFRGHGLDPVTSQVGVATAAGTWTAGTVGYFEYWSTETVEYTKDGVIQSLESAFEGDPYSLYVNTTAIQATITIPAPVNPTATGWRLYRSQPGMDLATDTSFPVGWLIGEGTFDTSLTMTDGGATTGSYQSANATAAGTGLAAWVAPTNVFVSDDAHATHTGVVPGELVVRFPSFTVTEPILGLEIELEGHRTGVISCMVSISNDGGATYGQSFAAPIVLSGTDATVVMGDASQKWGLNWAEAGVAPTKFQVRMVATDVITIVPNGTLSIDRIRARFTFAGTAATTETPFPAIAINQSGLQSLIGSHGAPPSSTTGDIYEGQLVLNDIAHPSFIRYSLPLEPDYFPSVYFVDFETSDNDRVTNIKTLNNRLGVFLKNAAYRVNYLPSENDATFDRGRCLESVSSSYGCYNSQCACAYTSGDGRTHLAYVSDQGIHTTDLFSVQNLTDDLDWRLIIDTSATSNPICLINDPEKWELLFYYRNDSYSDGERYRCLHLSYHPRHLKQGNPKVSGQVHMRNYDATLGVYASLESAWSVKRSTGTVSVYLGYGGLTANATAAGAGKVYRENGIVIPSVNPFMEFTTRRMFLAGFGEEFRLNELYNYCPSGAGTTLIEYTAYTVKSGNTAGEVAQTPTKQLTHGGAYLHQVQFNQIAEGLRIGFAQIATASDWKSEFLILDGAGFGTEDSGL